MTVRRVYAIDGLLERATFAARAARLARLVAFGVTTLAIVLLGAIVLDAGFGLSPGVLVSINVLVTLGALSGAIWIIIRVRSLSTDPRHLARLLESRSGVPNNQILNALEFERDASKGGVSSLLVGKTIEAGESLAPSLEAGVVVDRSALRRALLWLPLGPALALLLHLGVPNLFAMTLVRFIDPFGHHPAYTALSFDVSIDPGVVKHGRPALISVGISGPLRASSAELVFVDETNPAEVRDTLPMLPEPDDESGRERFALRVDRATASASFIIRTPRGESAIHRLNVVPVPSFEHATVVVRFPEYTAWPPVERPLGAGDVVALRDASVVLRAAGTLPLREGVARLLRPDGSALSTTLKVNPADPTSVEGSLQATESGRLEVELVGRDGTLSDETRGATLLVTEDAPPVIRVLEPDEHVFVVEGWAVDVVFEAEDDIGVASIECVRSVNGFPPSTAPAPATGGDVRRTLARVHFDTKELGARAGDVLTCFGVAWDAHPNPPQSARSGVVRIEVLSQEEYNELTRQEERLSSLTKEAAEFDEALRAQAAEREALLQELQRIEEAESTGQSMETERQALAEQLESFAKKNRELAERQEERAAQQPLYDAEKPWQEAIRRQAAGLREQSELAQELAGASRETPRDSGQRRATAGKSFRDESNPFGEEAMAASAAMRQDLEKLAAAERLLEKVEAVRQAILDQRGLADQLAEFRQKEAMTPQDALRMQDLADEQSMLEERLEKARQELAEAGQESAGTLPKMSEQAKNIADRVAESNAKRDQATAANACRAGEGRDAHAAADDAARKLETLLSECSESGQMDEMGQDLDGCLAMPKPGLKQALQQMAQARLGQMSSLGRRGKQGGGFTGMTANASIVGPHRPQGKQNRESKKVGGDAESPTAADGALAQRIGQDAEEIDAMKARTTVGAGSLLGVPAPYRLEAAAYFKRLAEDASRHSSPERTTPEGEKP